VILGASKEEQLIENLQSLTIAKKLTPKHMQEIDEILGNKPPHENPRVNGRYVTDLVSAL